MLEKICSKDRNRNWSQLERPGTIPKHKGIILEPEQVKVDPSAVSNRTPEVEGEVGDGKTEIEAPVSSRK